jgi:hypothetical protein
MAREFLEVIDLANAVHLCDDPVQDTLDFLVSAFSKECPLTFQAALVAKKLLPVKVRDAFPL